ncbi:hypothetical protein LJC36_01270 [Desulfovibrio sp. OttesenSCG-928-C14]|nr:hypothetical protein [Desulfovibrio sp. OttesenSCG-928-C14]
MAIKAFFEGLMEVGRYPEHQVRDVFSRHREYFDQVLHKNLKFRKRYAQAYNAWSEEELQRDPSNLLLRRIALGVEYTGEERLNKLFGSLLDILRREGHTPLLPEEVSYADTLPDGAIDLANRENGGYEPQMQRIRRFWSRLAIPEVREEE